MVLRMALPFQHPKTGVFWLRKRVPSDLVLRLGKKEERFSLRTLLERYARGEQVKVDQAGHVASSSEGAGATITCNDTLTDLLEAWWREASAAGRKPSAYESYRNSMKAFFRYSVIRTQIG